MPSGHYPPHLYTTGGALDSADLQRELDHLRSHLKVNGVGKGKVLALVTDSSRLTALLFYACSRLGVALFPLDPLMTKPRRLSLLRQAGADFLIHQPDAFHSSGYPRILSLPGKSKASPAREAEIALIIATSGSSGSPKAVMLAPDALLAGASAANAILGFSAGDCWLNCLPPFHIGGMAIHCRAALAGAAVVLHQGFDAGRLWHDLKLFPVTHLSLVPAMLSRLLDVADGPPPSWLRVVLIGGDALNEGLAACALAAGWPLWVSYGMSETAALVAASPATRERLSPPLGLIGGIQCEVVDESGQSTDGIGRIKLRGRSLMLGYANPLGMPGDGLDRNDWFLTSDLGQLDKQGLRVLGRADGILVSGGEKIPPGVVEERLLDCPVIGAACVSGLTDTVWGQRLCVYYEGPATPEEVEAWCREHIQGAMRPRLFRQVQRLPLLSNGKIDRQAIRQWAGDQG